MTAPFAPAKTTSHSLPCLLGWDQRLNKLNIAAKGSWSSALETLRSQLMLGSPNRTCSVTHQRMDKVFECVRQRPMK